MTTLLTQALRDTLDQTQAWTRSDTFFRDLILIFFGVLIGYFVSTLASREVR
jgi:hypothetical protein